MSARTAPGAPLPSDPQAASQGPPNDLDAFMKKVLERRDESWKKLHDYILSETERFELVAPGEVPVHGMRREFMWFVREGYLVRSPVRFDGANIPEADRRTYEDNWLREEKERETKRREKAKKDAAAEPAERVGEVAGDRRPVVTSTAPNRGADETSLDGIIDERGEPRFVSEAYFMRFRFEPGNYFYAGREQIDAREVVKIEYYPKTMFGDEGRSRERRGEEAKKPSRERSRERDQEAKIERQLNKVSLVTLWIDPAEHQIVQYQFDNVGFDFLPGRWIVRVDDVTASMKMGRVFEGIWLPRDLSVKLEMSLAPGAFRFDYGRQFYDYKKAETSARIRSIGDIK
jgi:hypothetical protein